MKACGVKKWNYYNEIDPFAAQWARNLIKAGLVPDGEVDERSILDVSPDDLRGFHQCHFFSGILGWPYALSLAGWEGPVWTGSCPCQPFSVAGAGKGTADERHLWPAFRRLIEECAPPVVFGEQTAGQAGRIWLAGVRADLEELGYACGGADLCAAGVSAPHIRQRLYWVADSQRDGGRTNLTLGEPEGRAINGPASARQNTSGLDNSAGPRLSSEGRGKQEQPEGRRGGLGVGCTTRWLADHDHDGPHRTRGAAAFTDSDEQDGRLYRGSPGGATPGWTDCSVIECGDGKTRRIPVEPTFFPLAAGLSPGRVGILRGAGNALTVPLAAEFVRAYMEVSK